MELLTKIFIVLGVHGLGFSRMRIPVGGQVIEDMDSYNRVNGMLQVFSPTDSRATIYAEGFRLLSSSTTSKGLFIILQDLVATTFFLCHCRVHTISRNSTR